MIERYISELLIILQSSKIQLVSACGYRLSVMKRVFTTDVETMAVDGVTFFVNPTWALGRSKIANLFTLLHEALHVWFRHPERLRDTRKLYGELVHMAADYAVNLHLEQSNCPYPMPDDGLIDRSFVSADGRALSTELILDRLIKQQQQEQQRLRVEQQEQQQEQEQQEANGQNTGDSGEADTAETGEHTGEAGSSDGDGDADDNSESASGDSGQGAGDNTPTSCGELLPAPVDLSPHEVAEQHIAAATLAKSAGDGTLPDWLQNLVNEAAQNSETDWLQKLHDKFATVAAARDYSFERFNNAYAVVGMIEPTLYSEGIGKVAIVGDESGSMSDDELNMVAEQTAAILQEWQPDSVEIIRHDSEIVYTESLAAGEQPTPRTKRSYGGTNFQPVLDYCAEQQVEIIVWVTDCMACDRPKDNGIPTIFLGTGGNAEYWHERELWGEFINLDS
jgi:predicted metal-dependent peptidase